MDFDREVKEGLAVAQDLFGDIDMLIDVFDLTIAWVKDQAAQRSGNGLQDLLGKRVNEVTSLSEEEYGDFVRGLILSKEHRYEVPMKAKDGKELCFQAEHYLIEVEGEIRFIAVKITGEKQ